ncbi:ATPase AAA [Fibrobacteres bacterium R8-0-B4]
MNIDITKKPLPVGQSFFDRVIEDGYYYVDKTLFVKDLLDRKAAVTLCARPRRFGKTLNQTMLKCFFEDTAQVGGKDTRALFRGLKIEAAGERYMERQGKYPVIYMTFKETKRNTFEASYRMLKDEIIGEFRRHRYVSENISDAEDREFFEKLASGGGIDTDYSASLKFLCRCLENHYGKKAVILIDEYDVPLENSWSRGFYQEMIDFIRPLLSGAFKDNPHLQTAVMTGCLRISKESIFTGLNNLEVISILNKYYSEYFGFTQTEMDALLEYYGFSEKRQLVMDWYNGYLFGNTEVYNPFSSVFVVNNWLADVTEHPKPYWVNTSGNDIIRDMIDKADAETKDGIETLMAGGTVSAVIHEDMTYGEMHKNTDNLWNFLLFTGYLKKTGDGRQNADGELTLDLSIPNIELRYIYKTQIMEWFKDKIANKNLDALHNAVLSGDVETFQNELSSVLLESISYMDSAESLYHGVMIGVLARINGYQLKSNRESGDGRSDLVLYSANQKDGTAVIFEFKVAPKAKLLSNVCADALKQIDDKNYAAYWDEEDYKNIIKYGIGFYGKRCKIQKGE